ncbi:MAG: bifunctional demethylmenaquinone methyltransferase/2-methoxy-6-polyprenyl-1,4-benzoquinol methylase UbiE [Phycisphaerae bacterium]|nr:bifunctional demethylmenaquinone methyltransferase/2-methoxy-6-polyprenyl-1,4-benzoquinol methylase UbiE [Phycisphaerae bacterium]
MSRQNDSPVWASEKLNNVHGDPDKGSKVQKMFDDVAARYDFTNRVISIYMDKRWRKRAIKSANIDDNARVLDLCCGTGDMVFEFADQYRSIDITGLDFSENMLKMARAKQDSIKSGRYKSLDIKWLSGDASDLGFPDAQFDLVSCAFGLRNLQDPAKAVAEASRVLKRKGKIVILEFGIPENFLLKMVVKCYLRYILPVLGRLASGSSSGAYDYFPRSVADFGTSSLLKQALTDAGFKDIKIQKICLATVLLITATKNLDEEYLI